MTKISSSLLSIATAMFGLAGLAVAATSRELRAVGLAIAVGCLFFVATKLSPAGRLAASLKPMVGRTVDIRIWGLPVADMDGTTFHVRSIRAFGAGYCSVFSRLPAER